MKLRHLLFLCIAIFVAVLFWFALEPAPKTALPPHSTAPPAAPKITATSAPSSPPVTSVITQPATPPKVALPAISPPQSGKTAASPPLANPDKRQLRDPLVTPTSPVVLPISVQPPDPAAEIDMHKVTGMFRDYRTLMGENPVGSNAEIMHTIMGDNPRQATLGPPEGLSLNAKGELQDHWGTPFFFHQLSADLMEIRSAGPDRKMYTPDDIVTK